MEKKIDVVGQMILSAIPIIITPLYAFYRVKKFKRGVLVILANMTIDIVILTANGDINWNLESEGFGPIAFTSGYVSSFIVDILFPLYFARKWTIEYNQKMEATPST